MAKDQLSEKHLKALELLKRNRLSIPDIAKQVGIDANTLHNLINKAPSTGELGRLFQVEFKKIDQIVEERTNRKMIQAREILYDRLLAWVKTIKNVTDITTKTKHKMLIDAINAMNKAYPQINIESYTWKTGMSQEDALNEFRRLTAVAKEATIGGRIQKAIEGGSIQIPLPPRQADQLPEDPQASRLRAPSQAEEVPPIEGSDQGDIRR